MNEQVTIALVAHAGEVLVVFTQPMQNLALPPQAARDLAKMMIERAEIAEQQMDAENG